MKKGIVAVCLTAIAIGSMAGVASAGKGPKAKTTVNELRAIAEDERTKITGHVNSKHEACEAGRLVTAFHDLPPAGESPNDFRLGSDHTTNKGVFLIYSEFFPDKVYVLVKKAKRGGVKCKGEESDTVLLDD
jgi:hypothetical protein